MGLLDVFQNKKVKELTEQNENLKRLAAANIRDARLTNLINSFNRAIAVYPSTNLETQAQRYTNTDDIYSLIRLLATTSASVPLYGYEVTKDEESRKAFNYLRKQRKGYVNPRKLKQYQTKALEDLEETDPVAMLLEHPHEKMSKYQFFTEVFSWLYLDGEAFIFKTRPEQGNNMGMTLQLQIWCPAFVSINISDTFPRQILSYNYKIESNVIAENVPASEVIHIKYFNPETNYMGDELRGLSPIKVLTNRLTRLDANMNVSVAQLQNSGTETIVYDKSLIDVSNAVEIIDKRIDKFYRHVSTSSNAGLPYFATGEMGAIPIGSTLADMNVAELAKLDFKKLCNAYGLSARLFNEDGTGSEISDDNAHEALYTMAVMPNVYMVRDALVNGLLPDFKDGVVLETEDSVIRIPGDGKNRFIDADISEIKELQADMSKQVASLAQAWWLTGNEKREQMDWEKFDDPLMDEVIIPSGFVPLSELLIPEPVEQVTPDGL